jgi:hypothetical protein
VGNIFQTGHTLFDARTNILLTQYIKKTEGTNDRLFEPRSEKALLMTRQREQREQREHQEKERHKAALRAEKKHRKQAAIAAAGKGSWRERMLEADSKIRAIAEKTHGHGSTHKDRLTCLLSMGLKNKEQYIYHKRKDNKDLASSWKSSQQFKDSFTATADTSKYDTMLARTLKQPLPARLRATIGTKQQRQKRQHRQLAKYRVEGTNDSWCMPVSGK